VTGWVTPPTPAPGPGPLVGWVVPDEPIGLSAGEIIRSGWRLTTANLGPFILVAAVPTILIDLASLPIWLVSGRMLERVLSFYADLDVNRYLSDPQGIQRELQAATQPTTQEALVSGVGTAVLLLIWMVGLAMITAATLDATAGHRPTVGRSISAALARPATVLLPGIILALGYALVILPLSLGSNQIAFGEYGTGRASVAALLSVGILVLEVAVFYLAIRWAPYFQVAVAEDVGLRRALSRSAEVTRGVRIRVALALIAVGILVAIVVGFFGIIAAFVVGIATRSFLAGVVALSIAFSAAGLVYLPLFAAMLTHVYRVRSGALAPSDAPGEPRDPDEPDGAVPPAGPAESG
jgi:Membrane domain of glycerophosphoryl diester phosphodiesterase